MGDLHLKYRPSGFDEVIGHEEAVESIRKILKKKTSHAFLFSGPAGVGKTTLARIIASEVGCASANRMEIDATTNSGVDPMRAVAEDARYAGLGETPTKVVIVDEAHAMSQQAWQSLLKAIEEPSPHTYWILCTTLLGKIPKTIQTRCSQYELTPVDSDLIYKLLRKVAKKEGLGCSDDVLVLLSEKCEGSPRRALTWLSQTGDCRKRKEAARIIRTSSDPEGEIIDLCRALFKGGLSWEAAMKLVKPIQDQNPEGLRMTILAYFSKVALDAKTPRTATNALNILSAFGDPYPNGGIAPLLVSLGELIFSGD